MSRKGPDRQREAGGAMCYRVWQGWVKLGGAGMVRFRTARQGPMGRVVVRQARIGETGNGGVWIDPHRQVGFVLSRVGSVGPARAWQAGRSSAGHGHAWISGEGFGRLGTVSRCQASTAGVRIGLVLQAWSGSACHGQSPSELALHGRPWIGIAG